MLTLHTSLLRHKKTVHGEKGQYSCDKCENTYFTKDSLTRHLKSVHGKEGQYSCCDNTYFTKDSFTRHVKSVHEDRDFACDQCDKSYADQTNLTRHVKSVHEDNQFACDKCDKSYSLNDNLKRHVKTVHKQEEGGQFQSDEVTNSVRNDDNDAAEGIMEIDNENTENSNANQDVTDNHSEYKPEAAIDFTVSQNL